MRYEALVPDGLEWDELPGERYWAVIIPADAATLPGLAEARAALEDLDVVAHPDHYLHCTLRELGGAGTTDTESIDAIGDVIASRPGWTAEVRGLYSWPTAVWSDPDPEGLAYPLLDKILGPIGNLPEHPYRARARLHLTLAYSQGHMPAAEVAEALAPYEDLVLGTIDIREAILAELFFTHPYPEWKVLRRFQFADS